MFAAIAAALAMAVHLLSGTSVYARPDDPPLAAAPDEPLAAAVIAPAPATSTRAAALPRGASAPRAKAAEAQPPSHATSTVPVVPFFSQFTDISSPKWQKVGCGITDLTMIVDYYHPDAATVNQLLAKGVAAGAYDYDAGWIYQGLINLSKNYGLDGTYHNLTNYDSKTALAKFKGYLADGPVILSVHYKFDPKSTIPHLVVVNAIDGDTVYVNDPATTKGTEKISLSKFLTGWTRKVIVIRPA